MKLFDTTPPFERLKKDLKSLSVWQRMLPDPRRQALDVLQACCDLKRPPSSIGWCISRRAIAFEWPARKRAWCSIIYNTITKTWFFITTEADRKLSEAFHENVHLVSAVERLFRKTDRLAKEAEERACAS
jgi:hypothetical protein